MSEQGDLEAWKEKLDGMSKEERKCYEVLRSDEGVAAELHRYDCPVSEYADSTGRRVGEWFYCMGAWGEYTKWALTTVNGKFLVMTPNDCFGIVRDL